MAEPRETAEAARRPIGGSGLSIAPLMLGGNVFGWSADAAESFAILDAFVDAGLNAIDTADVYSGWVPGHRGGESETVIGDWLASRGCRDEVVIATKVGAAVTDWTRGTLTRSHIIRSAEASLRRLRTDRIDLYQAHVDDPDTPVEETLEAFDRLVRAGKVRAIGASHYGTARLEESLEASRRLGLVRYQSYQACYNLCDRAGFEAEHQRFCPDAGLGVLCYSGLAKGFLTGRHRDDATGQWAERLRGYGDARGMRILAALDAVALSRNVSAGAVAIAWLIARPGVAAAIVAVNSAAELGELTAAIGIALDPHQMALLDAASGP